jgi:hypothetical protein
VGRVFLKKRVWREEYEGEEEVERTAEIMRDWFGR